MDACRKPAQKCQRIIGLTGGIGMGKTTVSDYLANVHKLPVLDADIYAREAVEPGSVVLEQIVARYGSGILLADGMLNRHRLGDIIFSSPPERLWLEQQIHPYVRDRLVEAITAPDVENAQPSSILVMVVPLLFEARMTDLVTETWVVWCPVEQQLERLMSRDRLSLEQAQARISSQMAIQKKTARADVVLDNSSTPENLYQQVDLRLAQQPDRLTVPQG
ncbi:dephospho-CoA kinase [Leptothermofonsia sichuanensis E412]|uniref:dephospho-CoA kinase n=1 Tax=Leptothermofonsia sichuanensis TaxID=2917832 RepID=UPI001CA7A61B|nr:dephospho-CoA kinase [Leptothermofonsia sichuanensis]QZZ20932.1 dephospho-CoA kinase [Leptothermofonsia sichuanensis E412]